MKFFQLPFNFYVLLSVLYYVTICLASKNPHKMMIYFNKKMPNYFYCSLKKPIVGEKLIVKAVPIAKLCELNGTEPIPEDYKSDCYNNVDESKFACKEKYRIMMRLHPPSPENNFTEPFLKKFYKSSIRMF